MAGNSSNTSSNSTTSVLGDADKRILHEIDTQLKEIEAITYYQQVKDERDQYRELLDQKLEDLRRASATIQRLEGELRDREELKRKLEAVEGELEKSQKRVGELESLRVIVGSSSIEISSNGGSSAEGTKTLLEMEKIFLKSQEDEVERRAKERLDSMKAEWEKTEKPRLVSDAAARSLMNIIENISDGGSSVLPQASMPSNPSSSAAVPEALRTRILLILDREAKRRIDSEFKRRVESESQKLAEIKLRQKIEIEWPVYIEQKLIEIQQKILVNVFALLKGPWNVPCKVCRAMHRVEFFPDEVASLIKDGEIELECNGSYVRPIIGLGDKLNPLAGPQRFKLTLTELIDMQLRQ